MSQQHNAHNAHQCLTKGRVQRAELDVGIDDGSIGVRGLDISRDAGGSLALTTATAEIGVGILVGGVCGVEPEHVGVVVIPQTHDEDHTIGKCLGHVRHSTLVLECVSVPKGCLLSIAELGGDRVTSDTCDSRLAVGYGLAALDIESLDLHGIAGANELCDDREFLGRVDGLALAVEVLDTHAVAVEIAAIGIANTSITISRVCSSAAISVASGLLDSRARVRCYRRADGIGLPDIHLGTARSVPTNASIRVV